MDISQVLEAVEWEPCEPEASFDGEMRINGECLPYVTHKAKLRIGAAVLDVVQLNTGQRLITQDSLSQFFR
jgi:hypothetical protein